ncbi:DUF4292 domain-containing protein [Flavobacterium sp.]|uniref:DUF4292 domain-containing protein n=1 Tax=Flavobacterium sp. TaxID=239 RepID=UPI00286A48AB|nr:DUF4292 domain-containing protein [Flavobacterium sp.]
MNKYLVIIFVIFLIGCKSKSVLVDKPKPETGITTTNIIENYYNNKNEFSTLYIKSNVQYTDEKQTQSVTAEIKIKKDKLILVSIRFLGITMAKALITPTSVSYYEKINGDYFEGDFSSLSQWLGTDLDFNKIQNMLLGHAIDNLKEGKYTQTVMDQTYRLDAISNENTKKTFYFDNQNFNIKKQEITQILEERMFQADYSNYKSFGEIILPLTINIDAYQKSKKTEINLNYNTVTFNEELSFPYNVPDGYTRILIK